MYWCHCMCMCVHLREYGCVCGLIIIQNPDNKNYQQIHISFLLLLFFSFFLTPSPLADILVRFLCSFFNFSSFVHWNFFCTQFTYKWTFIYLENYYFGTIKPGNCSVFFMKLVREVVLTNTHTHTHTHTCIHWIRCV